MAYVLDITTTDTYQELACPGATRVTVQVSNAAVLIGFGVGGDGRTGTATYPPRDEPLLPSVGGLTRQCDAIRVKNYTAGTPARVMLTAAP